MKGKRGGGEQGVRSKEQGAGSREQGLCFVYPSYMFRVCFVYSCSRWSRYSRVLNILE